MRCGAVHKLMVRYATEGVDPAVEAEFRAHLDGCADCRAAWAEIEEANAALALYDRPLPDDAFFERMTHAVMAATESTPAPARRSAFRLRWATASALTCLVLAVGFWRAGGGPQPAAPLPQASVATRLAAAEPEAPATPPVALTPVPSAAPAKPAVPAQPARPVAAPQPPAVRPHATRRPVATYHRIASADSRPSTTAAPVATLSAGMPPSEPSRSWLPADAAAGVTPSTMLGSTMRNASLAALALAAAPEARGGRAETRGDAEASDTLMLAMAPEVEDLGTATLVVSSGAPPSQPAPAATAPATAPTPAVAAMAGMAGMAVAKPEHKRSVLLAVAVVGATTAATEPPSDQP